MISSSEVYDPETDTWTVRRYWFDYRGLRHEASDCVDLILQVQEEYARLAQQGPEQLVRTEEAGGSIPSAGTIFNDEDSEATKEYVNQ